MSTYSVRITPEAESDLENIWGYITYELESPASAFKIVDDLYSEIATLDEMPKRYRIIPREPWKSRGVRFMFVHNFRVHYIVDDDNLTVTVFSVMYARANS